MFERNLLFRELNAPRNTRDFESADGGWLQPFASFFPFISNPLSFLKSVVGNYSDEGGLTNFLFRLKHPELNGRNLISSDPKALKDEWVAIRNRVVRPFLANAGPGAAAAPPATAAGTSGAVTLQEITDSLNAITLNTRAPTIRMHRPWLIFEHAKRNISHDTKKAAYLALKRASNPAQTAAAIQKTKDYLKQYDERLLLLKKDWVQVNRQLKRARATTPAAATLQTRLDAIDAQIRTIWQEIDNMPDSVFNASDVVRTTYTATVDGQTVSFHDRVDAYSTSFPEGFDSPRTASDTPAKIETALQQSGLSASRVKILKLISGFEGGFTTINTYDIAEVTWGLVQWAWPSNSDLTQALNIIKRKKPAAFRNRFQRYGLDVKQNNLVVTDTAGTEHSGSAAVQALNNSPRQTAAFCRAGLDPDISSAQMEAGAELEINKPLNHTTSAIFTDGPNKTEVRRSITIGDVITSEYGVAVIANQTVHGGPGSIYALFDKIFKNNKYHWPDADTWKPAIAEQIITAIAARDASRARELRAACETAANTFS